ncbi:MAG: DUF899 family protein [Myxococcales bacterium]
MTEGEGAGYHTAPPAPSSARQRMGWTFPWASSFGSDFNFDFGAGFTEEQQREEGIEYNYRRETPLAEIPSRSTPDGAALFAAMSGTDKATYTRERPGMSAFALEDGAVYHRWLPWRQPSPSNVSRRPASASREPSEPSSSEQDCS